LKQVQALKTLVELDHVTRRFDGRAAIQDVSLAVYRGEVVSLMGPNGAGKSTVLKLVLGLDRPDEGRVTLTPDMVIGYMPQRISIDPLFPLSVERFIRLRPGVSRADVRIAAERVGVTALLDSLMGTLSGGQLQRVLLARAIVRKPDLLVLDEPVQGVDVTGQVELYELIGRLRAEFDCGVLMVSHDLHLVMAATDRVICLNGHICCSGEPQAITSDPAYRALFGDDARLALYTHAHDHVHDEMCGADTGKGQET